MFLRSVPKTYQLLDSFEVFSRYNSFMSVSNNDVFFVWYGDTFFGLIVGDFVSVIHYIAYINSIFQDCSDCLITAAERNFSILQIAFKPCVTFYCLIRTWCQNLIFCQDSTDLYQAFSIQSKSEYSLYHIKNFFIYNQMVFVHWVNLITIWCLCTNENSFVSTLPLGNFDLS